MANPSPETLTPKRGRKTKTELMSPDVIFAIRYTYLTDPNSTMAILAKQFDVGTWTITQLLSGPEYEAIREQIHKTTTQTVRDRLHAASELASQKWIEAMSPAAVKGDHRPMRDLLQANRVIDVTQGITPPVIIQIGVQSDHVTLTATPVTPQLPSTTPPSSDTTPDIPPVTTPTDTTTPPPALPPVADPPAPVPASTPGTTGGKRRRGKGAGK